MSKQFMFARDLCVIMECGSSEGKRKFVSQKPSFNECIGFFPPNHVGGCLVRRYGGSTRDTVHSNALLHPESSTVA